MTTKPKISQKAVSRAKSAKKAVVNHEDKAEIILELKNKSASSLVKKFVLIAEDDGFTVIKDKARVYVCKPTAEERRKEAQKNEKIIGDILNQHKVRVLVSNDDDIDYQTTIGVSAAEKKFYKMGSIKYADLKLHLKELLKNSKFDIKLKKEEFIEIVMRGDKSFDFNFYKEFVRLFKGYESVRISNNIREIVNFKNKTVHGVDGASTYDINSFMTNKGFFTVFLEFGDAYKYN